MKTQIRFNEAIGKELTKVYNPYTSTDLYLIFGEEFVLVSVAPDQECDGDLQTDSINFLKEEMFADGLAAGILNKEEAEIASEKKREWDTKIRRIQYERLKKEFEP